jgi:predicted O-linked N-acetylglucosamine transferase (SPINDLY family)
VQASIAGAGIASDRIAFLPRAARSDYFRRYHELDVVLDPFPYNGHTATIDALWMGVPVVTLTGRTVVGRGGTSILMNAGLPGLVASTGAEYVDVAAGLARDVERLAALRAGLRQQVTCSPLVDGKPYTAAVEAALREMWKGWCGS